MRARFPLVVIALCVAGLACGAFGAADDETPVPTRDDASADGSASDGGLDPDGNPIGSDARLDAPGDAAPPACPSGTLAFAESFPDSVLPPPWAISYPGSLAGMPGSYEIFSTAGPTSPGFALRLRRTGFYGIAASRDVTLGSAKRLDLTFMARLTSSPTMFFQVNAGPTLIFRLLSDGTNVFVQNPTTIAGDVPILVPADWSSWKVHLDIAGSKVSVETGAHSSGDLTIDGKNATAVTVLLLSFVDGTSDLTSRPTVDFDDLAACTP